MWYGHTTHRSGSALAAVMSTIAAAKAAGVPLSRLDRIGWCGWLLHGKAFWAEGVRPRLGFEISKENDCVIALRGVAFPYLIMESSQRPVLRVLEPAFGVTPFSFGCLYINTLLRSLSARYSLIRFFRDTRHSSLL